MLVSLSDAQEQVVTYLSPFSNQRDVSYVRSKIMYLVVWNNLLLLYFL